MKFTSIAYKIFFGILVLSVFFLSLMWVSIDRKYTDVLRDKEVQYNITVSNKTKAQFDFIIDLMNRTVNSLSKNNKLRDSFYDEDDTLLSSNTNEKEDALAKRESVITLLNNTIELQSFVHSIHVLGVNQTNLSTQNSVLDEGGLKYYTQFLESARENGIKEGFWSGLHNANTGPNFAVKVLSFTQPVYDYSGQKLLGVIIVNLDYEVMQRMFITSSVQLNDRAVVVNSEGEILFNYPHFTDFHSVFEDYPQLLKNRSMQINAKVFGKDTLIVSESIDMANLKIIRMIPANSMTTDLNNITTSTRNILLLCIFICVLYAIWLTKTITRPLKVLTEACNRIERSDLSARVQIDTNDEFGHLGKTFNIMMEQLNKHFDQELADQKRKSEIQFQLLQAQINPHFLYNTLDSIKWMAVMQNVDNIAEMSTALIHLLKYNLKQAHATATLQDELESVKNYITIQKFRYGDTFTFTTDIDESTLNCYVLRFSIQPLVENSILHGFDDIDSSYRIHIASCLENNYLHIRIIDNGKGMNQEQKNKINLGKEEKCGKFSNIGTPNIRERIKLYFGESYGLIYDSEPEVVTVAELILPIIYHENNRLDNETELPASNIEEKMKK